MKKIVLMLSVMLAGVISVSAQNTVSFDNQSGEPALVKLIGPTSSEVEVPGGAKVGTNASAGRYIIKVRYGTTGKYHYAKGQEFEIKETATTKSEITITLHKVVAGNYGSRSISENEFDSDDSKRDSTPIRSTPSEQALDDASQKDAEQIQGTWKVVQDLSDSGTYGQATLYVVNDADFGFVFTIRTSMSTINGWVDQASHYKNPKFDATKTPKSIDLSKTADSEDLFGIYELKGDILKLCFGPDKAKRPTEFKYKKGETWIVLLLMRSKP